MLGPFAAFGKRIITQIKANTASDTSAVPLRRVKRPEWDTFPPAERALVFISDEDPLH
jgi:hypothetical protein